MPERCPPSAMAIGTRRGSSFEPKTEKRIVDVGVRVVSGTGGTSGTGAGSGLSHAESRARMLAMITGQRIGPSYGSSEGAASVREALRALRESGLGASAPEATLEAMRTPDEAPRLEAATPIETDAI